MTTKEKTMTSTETMRPEMQESQEKTSSLWHKLENGVKAIILAALLAWAKPAMPQTKDEPIQDSIKTEVQKKETPQWAFFIDPSYSPTEKVGSMRLSWGGSFHGIKVGGFLDLTGTPDDPVNGTTAFGKLTMSQSLDKIKFLKWTSVAMEYTFSSATRDKLRLWFTYVRQFKADGTIIVKFYPLSDRWFEPFVLVGLDKSFKKLKMSAFCGTDIKSKSFYGEWDISYQATKHIAPFVQGRLWWYTGKPHPDAYVGLRIKL